MVRPALRAYLATPGRRARILAQAASRSEPTSSRGATDMRRPPASIPAAVAARRLRNQSGSRGAPGRRRPDEPAVVGAAAGPAGGAPVEPHAEPVAPRRQRAP